MRKVRTLRHWKQRFQENAKFIWRRPVTWDSKDVKAGDPIPESLANNRNKLRRFWEAKVIELAEFEAPDVATGQAPVTDPEPDPIDANIPLGPNEVVDFVEVYGEEVSIDEVIDLALEDFGGTISEWNSLDWLDREERLQNVVEMMLDLGVDEEVEDKLDTPSIAGMKPEELITKETDRKWHVSGVEEVFKSKTLATSKAAELIAEAKAAEDAWLDGDNQED